VSQDYMTKIETAFIPIKCKQISVGRPSLAALSGGHGGPPHQKIFEKCFWDAIH
jgi:hypothetical protein